MVFEKIREILCEQFELDEDRVTMDSNLISDLGADSLDVIDLAMSIEDEFDIEVPAPAGAWGVRRAARDGREVR